MALMWILMATFGIASLLLLWVALVGDRSRGRRRCPKCWYDMRGSPTLICPECGHDASNPNELLKTRRRPKLIALALLLSVAGLYLDQTRQRVNQREPLNTALLPTTGLLALSSPNTPEWLDILAARTDRREPWSWQEAWFARQCERLLADEGNPAIQTAIGWQVYALAAHRNRFLSLASRHMLHPDPNVQFNIRWRVSAEAPRLSDEELIHAFNFLRPDLLAHEDDYFVNEMIRRRRPQMRALFLERMAELSNRHERFKGPFLTALRRFDGEPDPLRLRIIQPPAVLSARHPLPMLDVRLEHSDLRGEAFELWIPDRPGLDLAWLVDVRDSNDTQMPVRPGREGGRHIGISMEMGRAHSVTLDMNEAIQPLPAGRYQVRVLFSSWYGGIRNSDVGKMLESPFCWATDPFDLTVTE